MPMTLSDARTMTLAILAKNYAYNWSVSEDRAIKRMGCTHHDTRTITYSKYYLESAPYDEIVNTIRHECAHAIAGPHAGHGPIWRRTFIYLGGNGKRTGKASETQRAKIAVKRENPLWDVSCPTCNISLGGFHRRPKKAYNHKICKTPIVLTKTR
jgi:hypothetical protein